MFSVLGGLASDSCPAQRRGWAVLGASQVRRHRRSAAGPGVDVRGCEPAPLCRTDSELRSERMLRPGIRAVNVRRGRRLSDEAGPTAAGGACSNRPRGPRGLRNSADAVRGGDPRTRRQCADASVGRSRGRLGDCKFHDQSDLSMRRPQVCGRSRGWPWLRTTIRLLRTVVPTISGDRAPWWPCIASSSP